MVVSISLPLGCPSGSVRETASPLDDTFKCHLLIARPGTTFQIRTIIFSQNGSTLGLDGD